MSQHQPLHDPSSKSRSVAIARTVGPLPDPVGDGFHELLDRFESRLPDICMECSRYLRQPHAQFARIPVALFLIVGGIFSFLPVLGIWMLPLGLLLLAVDLPLLRPPVMKMMRWIERKWPHKT